MWALKRHVYFNHGSTLGFRVQGGHIGFYRVVRGYIGLYRACIRGRVGILRRCPRMENHMNKESGNTIEVGITGLHRDFDGLMVYGSGC